MGWAEGASFRREVEGIEPADAIVVLSGMLLDRKDAPLGEWSDAVDRFEGGVELFKAGKAPVLVFTGGHVPWRLEDRPEGEILKERAVKLGVPREKILVTGKVGNTAQEAEAVVKLFRNSEFGIRKQINPKIILVTSAFHMRRARMLFERQGFEVEPFPVDFQTSDRPTFNVLSFVPSAQALAKSETAMREGIGILYYSIIKR